MTTNLVLEGKKCNECGKFFNNLKKYKFPIQNRAMFYCDDCYKKHLSIIGLNIFDNPKIKWKKIVKIC